MGLQIIKEINFILIIALVLASLATIEATGYDILSNSVPEGRLNITTEDFEELCQLNKQNLTKNLKKAGKSLSNFTLSIMNEFLVKVKDLNDSLYSDVELNKAFSKYCLEDSKLKEKLRKLINDVQLCYNEEDKLTDDEKKKVLETTVFAHCFHVFKLESIRLNIFNCTENRKQLYDILKCYKDYSQVFESSHVNSLPLPFIRNQAQCDILLQTDNCLSNKIKQYCPEPEFSQFHNTFQGISNHNRKLDNCVPA